MLCVIVRVVPRLCRKACSQRKTGYGINHNPLILLCLFWCRLPGSNWPPDDYKSSVDRKIHFNHKRRSWTTNRWLFARRRMSAFGRQQSVTDRPLPTQSVPALTKLQCQEAPQCDAASNRTDKRERQIPAFWQVRKEEALARRRIAELLYLPALPPCILPCTAEKNHKEHQVSKQEDDLHHYPTGGGFACS